MNRIDVTHYMYIYIVRQGSSYKLDPNSNAAALPGRTRIVTARYVSGHGRHVLASRSLAAVCQSLA